ncbi:hypothetical protein RIF29_27105 [Crotalaria pallida]|uniref:Uncharacterized protein n=1 Tax=Crotalaria pallida TaxID=3830 RepID=A0AAN9ENG7_CROPI
MFKGIHAMLPSSFTLNSDPVRHSKITIQHGIAMTELVPFCWLVSKSRFATPKGRDPVVIRMSAMGCAWLGRSLAIL